MLGPAAAVTATARRDPALRQCHTTGSRAGSLRCSQQRDWAPGQDICAEQKYNLTHAPRCPMRRTGDSGAFGNDVRRHVGGPRT